MSWQGANVSRRKRTQSGRLRQSSETVEATINRLTKSYSAAIDCVGACHRAAQEKPDQTETRSTIAQVARTARSTMERAILVDPLVRSHASGLFQQWETWSKDDSAPERFSAWGWVIAAGRVKTEILTSASHSSTILRLSYLTLINYADLLLSGCVCHDVCKDGVKWTETILDRGAVSPILDMKDQESFCCWTVDGVSEREEDTARLALMAYVDALLLDGSDAMVWFKMAAAVRRLENLNCNKTNENRTYFQRRYRRLEQHALESAQACWLSQHRPPNRMIFQAYEEWKEINNPEGSLPESFEISPCMSASERVLQLDLPRYSWAFLGRCLVRLCREGTDVVRQQQSELQLWPNIGPNAVVRLTISPLLTLPSTVLGLLISYLENTSVASLECTCRSLSVAVLAARVRADRSAVVDKRRDGREAVSTNKSNTDKGEDEPTNNDAEMEEAEKEKESLPKYPKIRDPEIKTPRQNSEDDSVKDPRENKDIEISDHAERDDHVEESVETGGDLKSEDDMDSSEHTRKDDVVKPDEKEDDLLQSEDAMEVSDYKRTDEESENIGDQLRRENDTVVKMAQNEDDLQPEDEMAASDHKRKGEFVKEFEHNGDHLSAAETGFTKRAREMCQNDGETGGADNSDPKPEKLGDMRARRREQTLPKESRTPTRPTEKREASRVSKRLKTQIENSGKLAERSSRKTSVEYCLVGAVLGMTPNNREYLEQQTSEELLKVISLLQPSADEAHARQAALRSIPEEEESVRHQARERIGPGSLCAFLLTLSEKTPALALFQFLSHISLHVEDVFSCESHASVALSSCALDALDLLAKRKGYQDLVSCWSMGTTIETGLTPLQLFSVDLLHAELRMKRIESGESLDLGFDGDINFVGMVIPELLSLIDEEGDMENADPEVWVTLKGRCFWLVGTFLLWHARRVVQGAGNVREVENECILNVDKILMIIQESGIQEIRTPHLEGIGRSGPYWKKLSPATLAVFRKEIQASSIVLVAQDQFVKALAKLNSTGQDHDDDSDPMEVFNTVGDSLLERYKIPAGKSGANHAELIDDFLSLHGEELCAFPLRTLEPELPHWFSQIMPLACPDMNVLKELRTPSILTILATCLSFRSTTGKRQLLDQLVSVMLTLSDLRKSLITSFPPEPAAKHDEATPDSDDDFSLGSEEDSQSLEPTRRCNKMNVTLRSYGRLLGLLLMTVSKVADKEWLEAWDPDTVSPSPVTRLINDCFIFATDSVKHKGPPPTKDGTTEDVFVFEAIKYLLETLYSYASGNEKCLLGLRQFHMKNLVTFVTIHEQNLRRYLPLGGGIQDGSKFLVNGIVLSLTRACSDIGHILSMSLCSLFGKTIRRSLLFSELEWSLAPLCCCLTRLWTLCTRGGDSLKRGRLDLSRLRVAVAVAIVSICGSASCTKEKLQSENESPKVETLLADIVDSDTSAAACVPQDDLHHEELLRASFLAVQCIFLMLDDLRDQDLTTDISFHPMCPDFDRFLLPSVLEKVLGFFADILLLSPSFQDSDIDDNPLWADYSFGSRSIGLKVDKLLCRTYKALYGFNLLQAGEPKESYTNTSGQESRSKFKPQSVKAAAQLYRCMMRTCSHGRKAPPRAALMAITSALPVAKETETSKIINHFLFSSHRSSHFCTSDISALIYQTGDWEMHFSSLQALWKMPEQPQQCSDPDEAGIVRKGLASFLSQGAMPSLENVGEKDPRLQAQQAESELWNRFDAVLYNLIHKSFSDCEEWFRFSQLCIFKADLVADRLGMSTGFSRSNDFMCEPGIVFSDRGRPLSELVGSQEREALLAHKGWCPSIGSDLSVYLQHSWSSFESLKSLQRKVGEDCTTAFAATKDPTDLTVWNEIAGMYTEGKLSAWQQAWGGIFVSSLRILATRCICLALFILHKDLDVSARSRRVALIAEIAEALGTSFYSSLVGSERYGFPIGEMTKKNKRDVAEVALSCFQFAVEEEARRDTSSEKNKTDEESEGHADERITWDLHFMMGKCHEKIAGTYVGEDFTSSDSRVYEKRMMFALTCYSKSFCQAQGLEKDGSLVVEQQGGSSHGATEVLYRLHASRLKCLLRALKYCDREREKAEEEALRLTEPFFFLENKEPTENSAIQDRVWDVAADVVSAMVHCRTKHSCFHRSVFRHAQALMWAPVLSKPNEARQEGSFGVVPAVKALKMRGLNSDSAVESAASAMRALFDKKRPQLCGVWVTSPTIESYSAFQRLNMEVRKYDSLRGKYISAFLLCLQSSKKRDDLENFLRWTNACQRDLPSYFNASAKNNGNAPATATHIYETLVPNRDDISSLYFLTTVKREANAALATVIHHDVGKLKKAKDPKQFENELKLAYSCVLRLNCDPSLLQSRRIRRSSGVKPVVDALVGVYSRISKGDKTQRRLPGDWSMDGQIGNLLEAALQKCRALFPSLSGSYLSSKKMNPKKKKEPNQTNDVNQTNDAADGLDGSKRKEHDGTYTILKQFNTQVPEGLEPGESFLTEIKLGEVVKRIRLTVPEGGASDLRFKVRVPAPEFTADESAQ